VPAVYVKLHRVADSSPLAVGQRTSASCHAADVCRVDACLLLATRSGHPHEPLGGVRKFHTPLVDVSFESGIKIALANPVASATGRRPPASSTPLLPRYVHR